MGKILEGIEMHRQRIASYAIILFLVFSQHTVLGKDYYGQPGEFLRYSPSARALAMGRAYTALGQDANALHWNPGALGQLQRTGLSVVGTQASLFGLSNYTCISIGLPFEVIDAPLFQKLDNITVGMSFLNLTSDITEANDSAQLLENSSMSSSQGAFSFAVAANNNIRYLKDFSIGAGVDFIWNNIYGIKASATGLNAGIYYHNETIDILNWFRFAFAFKNINEPNIAIDSRFPEIIPKTGKLGLAFLPPFCSSLPPLIRPLLVSVDYDLVTIGNHKRGLYFGLEYNVSRLESYLPIRIRLGSNTKESSFTLGFSLDLPANPFVTKGLQYLPSLDYSFNFYNDGNYLGDVKQGAVSFAWTPKTPQDWYEEGMIYYPDDLISTINDYKNLIIAAEKFKRVFDNPQVLFNPNYEKFGYDALMRLGDLEIASAWLENDSTGLMKTALESYARAGDCISFVPAIAGSSLNSTSLLYRLQNEIKNAEPTDRLFDQPYVSIIDDKESVKFLRGFSYYQEGGISKAVEEWHGLDLPIARFYLAKATQDTAALKALAFSRDTKVSTKILFPLNSDFDVADNALYEYAILTNSDYLLTVILKLFPLSDMQNDILTLYK